MLANPIHNQIVFCDFDGTITTIETFSSMLRIFNPDLSQQIIPQMYNRQITLREGVRRLVESIPSQSYQSILEYAKNQSIRPGLLEFLEYLKTKNIPFVIVSGGLRGMIEVVLEKYSLEHLVAGIYALEVDTTDQYLKVYSAFEEGDELVAKVEVMQQFVAQETIVIGDSVTDINMSLKADIVFARDRLIDYLEGEQVSFRLWEDFFDILKNLEEEISFS